MRLALVLLVVFGCAPDEEGKNGRSKDPGGFGSTLTTATASTSPTSTTTTSPTTTTTDTFDCSLLPEPPGGYDVFPTFATSEDFDFDAFGNIGIVFDGNMVVKNLDGETQVISPSVSWSTAGTQVLSNGDWVVADVGGGAVQRISATTGAIHNLSTGFSWANGVEVASNDDLYVTDFGSAFVMRVNANDPTDTELLASDMPQANGIAISPDENTLYFVLSFEKRVIAMDRLPDGSWDAPRSFHETPSTSSFQGLEVDGCGNVYWSDLKMGGTTEIWRKTPDGVHAEVLVTLPTPYVPNLHFGSGVGGWERDWLYVADRDDGTLYMIEVGIPGKKQVGLP